jgi:ABC-2 type transport system ATP-binding protein
VQLRLLGTAEACRQWLAQRSDVHDLVVEGSVLRFSHDGDQSTEVALLRDLVQSGFQVAEFGCRPKSLEDVFMHVTRGAVQ